MNHPDGQYDYVGKMDVGMWWDENTTRVNGEMGLTGEKLFRQAQGNERRYYRICRIELDPKSQEYVDSLNLKTLYEKYLPRAVMAKTAEEFETEWNTMSAELEKSGLDGVETAYQALYEERMETWD